MTIMLQGSRNNIGLDGLLPSRAAILDIILEQRTFDKLPADALYQVMRTCNRIGCATKNVHCNPLMQLLIKEGAPLKDGRTDLMLCDKRKVMICEEMNKRATAFRVAFAMGLHKRLGANSLIKTLGSDLAHNIIISAGIGKSNTPDAKYRWFPRAPLESWRTP